MEQLAVTPEKLAELTPLGINRIRLLINTDPSFPAFKNGKNHIIPISAFVKWMEDQAYYRVGYPEIMRRGKRERN